MGTLDYQREIDGLVAAYAAAAARAMAIRPADYPNTQDQRAVEEFVQAGEEIRSCERALWDGPNGEIERLRRPDASADSIEYGIAYLEIAPNYFRSGYTRNRITRLLAKQALNDSQRGRLRALILSYVDCNAFGSAKAMGQLARGLANNELRRQLRSRFTHNDIRVIRRSLMVLLRVKRPGIQPKDFRVGGALNEIVFDHERFHFYELENCTRRYWSADWERELRQVAAAQGPNRASAEHILRLAEYRRTRREGRRPGP